MKKQLFLSLLIVLISLINKNAAAQNTTSVPNIYRDSVVQLYGVIMTADSLKAIPFASIVVNNKGRGTITNNDGVFSIAVNKGEKIVFCIRQKDTSESLVEENTITFVAIHELAHIMTKSVGHTPEFWENFKRLLKEAIKANLYTKEDYTNNPKEYCGIKVTDSPLDV